MACHQLLVFLAIAVTSADAFGVLSAAAPRAFGYTPTLSAKMSGSYEPMPEPEPVQKRKKLRPLEDTVFYASSPSEDPSITCWMDPTSNDRWVCAPDSVLSGFTSGEESPDDGY